MSQFLMEGNGILPGNKDYQNKRLAFFAVGTFFLLLQIFVIFTGLFAGSHVLLYFIIFFYVVGYFYKKQKINLNIDKAGITLSDSENNQIYLSKSDIRRVEFDSRKIKYRYKIIYGINIFTLDDKRFKLTCINEDIEQIKNELNTFNYAVDNVVRSVEWYVRESKNYKPPLSTWVKVVAIWVILIALSVPFAIWLAQKIRS